jgi:NhaP-type Na+/H+ or K+/H+ antiporter
MSHYTRRNMSRSTQAFSSSVFRLLAGICESVVFVYIGA